MATSLPSLPPLTGDTSWIDNPTGMEGLPTPIAPARPSTSSATPASSSAAAATSTPTAGYLSQLEQWAAGLVNKATVPSTGLSLEDIIFILVGLILVAAAVFSFKGAQTVVQTVSRTASKAAEAAA